MLHSPSSFVEWISRLVIGNYFKEHVPNSLPKLYLLYALMGAHADGHIPHSNRDYWRKKIERNQERDAKNKEALLKLG